MSFSDHGDLESGNIERRRSSVSSSSSSSRRFFDSFREKMHLHKQWRSQRSASQDGEPENLEEALGFPPSATKPPEEEEASSQFRSRSRSEVAYNDARRRSSGAGVLVLFSSTEKEKEEQRANNNNARELFSKSFDGEPGRLLTSAGDVNPLFVDTQLANFEGDHKRGAMTSVFDFVKGRNRTNSCCAATTNAPFSPSASTMVNPRNSCDSPGLSPSSRGKASNRYARMTSLHNQRSLDSGLDLGSPSTFSTALLIKDSSLFDSFDNLSMNADVSRILFESQDSVYSLFFKAHNAYSLIPVSSKLVVLDTRLPVSKAFYALVYNDLRSAPLWDSKKHRYVGMLTITDFIRILAKFYDGGGETEAMPKTSLEFEKETIQNWMDILSKEEPLKELITIEPMHTLFRAVQMLVEKKVHRLPVLDRHTGNISFILSHRRLIKFLSLYMHDLPRPSYMEKTPRELGIGCWGEVLTLHRDTKLIDAMRTFLKARVSAMPIVDEEDRVVDIYAKFDVITLANEKTYSDLNITVTEALQKRSDGVRTCRETDSLWTVFESIVKAEVHRLIVVDEARHVVGIVSLSDILKFLILDSAPPERDTPKTDCSPVIHEDAEEHH